MQVSAFGYRPWAGAYEEPPADLVEVLLAPLPVALDSLGITAAIRMQDPLSLSPYAFAVGPATIRAMPALVESDVLRVLSLSPSAAAVSDYMSVPYVRGGAGEGTPIMLDGVRLFNPFHLGGILLGGERGRGPARGALPELGGRCAACCLPFGRYRDIDARRRPGSPPRGWLRRAGVLALLTVEGPLGEGMSYLASGRRTYLDVLAKLFGVNFPYDFSDMHVRVVKDLPWDEAYVADRLPELGILLGHRYGRELAGRLRLGGARRSWPTTATGWRAGGCWTLRQVTAASTTECSSSGGWTSPVPDTQSMVVGLMAEDRLDARGTWSIPRGTLVAGIQAIRFTGDHDHTRADFEDVLVPHAIWRRGWRVGAFANTERSLGDAWAVRAGLRTDWFAGLGVALSPLAELARTGEWWKARLGVARSHQMLASLRDEEAIGASAVAYDLMVPVERGPLPSNTEVTAGLGGRGVRLAHPARRLRSENASTAAPGDSRRPVRDTLCSAIRRSALWLAGRRRASRRRGAGAPVRWPPSGAIVGAGPRAGWTR